MSDEIFQQWFNLNSAELCNDFLESRFEEFEAFALEKFKLRVETDIMDFDKKEPEVPDRSVEE